MALKNVNELILDRVRSLVFTDLSDGSIIGRLTQLEESSLQTAAEAEDVVDAVGALISRMYRAKTGRFEAQNSLLSIDLLAQQFGSEKEIASETQKIIVPSEITLTVKDGKVVLPHTPHNEIKYIYKLEKNGLAQKYTVGASVSETEFTISDAEITVPTDVTGKIYVLYDYESTQAVRTINDAERFPEAVGVKIFVVFRDVCNENIKYTGAIVANKGKIDPSAIDVALTSTGKHPFAIDFMKDYCEEEDTGLFSFIVDGE